MRVSAIVFSFLNPGRSGFKGSGFETGFRVLRAQVLRQGSGFCNLSRKVSDESALESDRPVCYVRPRDEDLAT